MAKVLMKGNEAIAEAALRAGCQAFFGYPITPQSEIPEYLARELPARGGVFLQAESELAAINMVMGAAASGARVMTSTSGPGFCLKLETIATMALSRLPAVIVLVMRSGPGFGTMKAAQEDYEMIGNGGYKAVKLAPAGHQEAVNMIFEAFDIADQYRNPVIVMLDGLIGQVMEPLDFDLLPEARKNLPPKDWALHGTNAKQGRHDLVYLPEGMSHYQVKHWFETELYPSMIANECRVECLDLAEAQMVLCAYGTAARLARAVKDELEGQEGCPRLGIIRPQTLWPFPYRAFEQIGPDCRAVVCPELNIMGQMIRDAQIGAAGRWPVSHVGDGPDDFLTAEDIRAHVLKVWQEVKQ